MSELTDKIKGNWNIIQGKIKEEYGAAVGDAVTFEEGQEDQFLGNLQKAAGKTKEEIKDFIDRCC